MLQLEHPLSQLDLDSHVIKQREKAWQSYVDTDFPSKKTERWRYTDVNALYEKFGITKAKLHTNAKIQETLSSIHLDSYSCNIVFVDGLLAHVDKIEGLSVKHFLPSKQKRVCEDALDYLNEASCLSGAILEVKENVKLPKPITMVYLQTKDSQQMMVNYRHSIVLRTNAKCLILERFIALSEGFSAVNIYTDIILHDAARCTYDALANASLQKILITHKLGVMVGRDAQYETFQMAAYAALNRMEFDVNLHAKGGAFNAKGIYALAKEAKVDYRFNVNHHASNTHSEVLFRGVIGGKASMTFNARAYVAKGLHGVKALQNNRNIQLSNTAEINTKPELEIYSDDVVCSHGATIGQLDQQALFYLQSRGINKNQATALLIESFVKELITLLERDEMTITSYLNALEEQVNLL